jgi:NTE family protein
VPAWIQKFIDEPVPPRPAARAIRSLKAAEALGDGAGRPFLHLIDGGVSDNVGMRSVLDALEILEALHDAGQATPLDRARRIIVFVVNSLSVPPTDWDTREEPPNPVSIMLKSAGVPIDHFSYESIELLKDTAARWNTIRSLRRAVPPGAATDPAVAAALRVPEAEIYAIDVSFAALADMAEVDYLNRQPTSFVLTPEAVDRLRAAAGRIIEASPEFRRLLKDTGARVLAPSSVQGTGASGSSVKKP